MLEGKGFNVVDDANRLPIVKEKRIITTPGYFEYLKIAEGCDKHCTYCIIPKVRGNFRSYPAEYLVEQAKHLVHNEQRAYTCSTDNPLWNRPLRKESLPMLIHELAKIEDLKWIRIQYCYPEEIKMSYRGY
ncbi:MAG: radical SAM protein [Lachnospira eligens]